MRGYGYGELKAGKTCEKGATGRIVEVMMEVKKRGVGGAGVCVCWVMQASM